MLSKEKTPYFLPYQVGHFYIFLYTAVHLKKINIVKELPLQSNPLKVKKNIYGEGKNASVYQENHIARSYLHKQTSTFLRIDTVKNISLKNFNISNATGGVLFVMARFRKGCKLIFQFEPIF